MWEGHAANTASFHVLHVDTQTCLSEKQGPLLLQLPWKPCPLTVKTVAAVAGCIWNRECLVFAISCSWCGWVSSPLIDALQPHCCLHMAAWPHRVRALVCCAWRPLCGKDANLAIAFLSFRVQQRGCCCSVLAPAHRILLVSLCVSSTVLRREASECRM